MVRKIVGHDIGHIYAMKVLKKATLKGDCILLDFRICVIIGSISIHFFHTWLPFSESRAPLVLRARSD